MSEPSGLHYLKVKSKGEGDLASLKKEKIETRKPTHYDLFDAWLDSICPKLTQEEEDAWLDFTERSAESLCRRA